MTKTYHNHQAELADILALHVAPKREVKPCTNCGAVAINGRCVSDCQGRDTELEMMRAEFLSDLQENR